VTRAVNWYDVVVFVALLYGVWSGMRAGLTGEIIRVIGLVLMVLLAAELYQPAGDWIQNHSQLTDETAHLLAFVSIAVVVYLLSVAARLAMRRRMQQFKLSSLVENVGGAFAGVIRVTVIMAWVTVVLSLTNNEFLQRNVSRESRFGSFVVAQLPALQSAVEKTMPQKMWLLQDLKRPPEPNYEEGGTTDTNTNRPQAATP
jgi:membrane protein required for colicin V production